MNSLRNNDWRDSNWTSLQVMAWLCFRDRRVVSSPRYKIRDRVHEAYIHAPDRPIEGAYKGSAGCNTLNKTGKELLAALRQGGLSAGGKKNGLVD